MLNIIIGLLYLFFYLLTALSCNYTKHIERLSKELFNDDGQNVFLASNMQSCFVAVVS